MALNFAVDVIIMFKRFVRIFWKLWLNQNTLHNLVLYPLKIHSFLLLALH